MKITIVGSGAIGGLAGAYMAMNGEDVTFVDVDKEHVETIRTKGIFIDGGRGDIHVPPQKAATPDELKEPLEAVFLAVKSQHTLDAAREIEPFLTKNSFVVSLQNGLVNEEQIASVVGWDRTIGALPDYGGAYVDPGHLEFVIDGPVYVGEMDGQVTPRIKEVARLLSYVAKSEITTNIRARIWAKTCYSGQVLTSALVDMPSYLVLAEERARRVSIPIVRERLQVAYAHGIDVPGGPFFAPALYLPKTHEDTLRVFAFMDEALLKLSSYRRQETAGGHVFVKKASGIHWDIVYRKRKSEVQWSHAPLEDKAREKGIPVPLNHKLHSLIYEMEDQKRQLGWHNIEELRELVTVTGNELP